MRGFQSRKGKFFMKSIRGCGFGLLEFPPKNIKSSNIGFSSGGGNLVDIIDSVTKAGLLYCRY